MSSSLSPPEAGATLLLSPAGAAAEGAAIVGLTFPGEGNDASAATATAFCPCFHALIHSLASSLPLLAAIASFHDAIQALADLASTAVVEAADIGEGMEADGGADGAVDEARGGFTAAVLDAVALGVVGAGEGAMGAGATGAF